MGLDSVELVIEVEESFGIKIPDQEASEIITVGDLLECVMRKLGHEESRICLSSAAFYALRSALMNTFGVSRSSVRPASQVEEFLPIASRRRDWEWLGQSLGMRLPDLQRPSWLTAMILISFLVSLVWLFASISLLSGTTIHLAFACFIISILIIQITRPLERHLVSGCQTMRGLTLSILRLNYSTFAESKGSINRLEIWDAVKAIIVEQLGVKPEKVTPDASFVGDFGMD
jgi:acyl carrier protein